MSTKNKPTLLEIVRTQARLRAGLGVPVCLATTAVPMVVGTGHPGHRRKANPCGLRP